MDRETILKQYESEFIDWLEKCCQVYKAIGMSISESPMWIQYKKDNLFASSQGSKKNDYLNIYCNLELKEEHKEYFSFNQYNYEEIYDHFRDLKYNYIEKNHPTIYSEIRNA
tara:strand:+ start:279 stop:614 length:336 start_codon:yes stop_codon:yes gene_type:complete